MLAYLLPCVQNIIHTVFQARQTRNHIAVKRYSSIDNSPSLNDSIPDQEHLSDLMPTSYTNESNLKVVIRPSVDIETDGQVYHSNLIISKCQGCSFSIMRSLENVYIDGCINCQVFIGPCLSTFFVRNTQKSRIRCISQQLRVSNSENIIVQGIVGVRPVLEQCQNIQFYSLGCKIYEDLIWQIEKAKIDIFINQIYECYDYTPKKQSNFSNGQKMIDGEIDRLWEMQIRLNDLDWGLKNAYLPRQISMKKSMIGKVYTENEIKNNWGVSIVFGKMTFKQFIAALNCSQLYQKFTIIQKLPAKPSLKFLKNVSNYRQSVKNSQKNPGQWYFLLVKTVSKLSKGKIGVGFIQERELVWKLFQLADQGR